MQYIITEDRNTQFRIIHEHSRKEFFEYQRTIKDHLSEYIKKYRDVLGKKTVSGLWKAFHDWRKENNAPVGYAYAFTVHKSQGSTYRNVFIDARNIEMCTRSESDKTLMKKCMYTAVTRASKSILLYW